MIIKAINLIGLWTLGLCELLGRFVVFLGTTILTLFTTKLKLRQMFLQMQAIGVQSFTIIFITGAFTGMVGALNGYLALRQYSSERLIGMMVGLAMTREFGPVLTGLMITARSGSAIAAEIGSMNITEQIDALRTLRINPYQYLIVPRIVASVVIMPFVSLFSMVFGVIGGYVYYTYILNLNPESYFTNMSEQVELFDIAGGMIKSSVFGLILSVIGTYNGYNTRGGAQGVGRATTRSVVTGSILILIANFFLSSLLFNTGAS